MDIINAIDGYAVDDSKIAHIYRESSMSYKELKEKSDALACFIIENMNNAKKPVIVYGHKEHLMIVSFIACIKSGRAYIPVDSSMPEERIKDIFINSDASLILNARDCSSGIFGEKSKGREEIEKIIQQYKGRLPDITFSLKQEDICYIIYTSGSTGKPKGVQITLHNLMSFINWGLSISRLCENEVFMNQAPFSFDLSVMDLYLSLASGSTLFSIDKQMTANMSELFNYFSRSNISIWVSTPSFAEMCLASVHFNRDLLNNLKQAIFCGETLTCNCAKRLHERFEGITVTNCYGPTEATVAISSVDITKDMYEDNKLLPVGIVKQDCSVIIADTRIMKSPEEELCECILSEGKKGEILIIGDSVGKGYYNDREATENSFFKISTKGRESRGYRTGDEGYIKNDLLYYSGRIDFQIKLNGYRIELEDVESNLRKVSKVKTAVVFPIFKNEKIQYLAAAVVLNEGSSHNRVTITSEIKEELKAFVPYYMVPRRIIIKESLPMNANGKVNRKLLMEEF